MAVLAFNSPDYFEISKQLDIFTHVFKEISLYYVDDTEPGELMEEALVPMLASLDPYTNFIPEEQVEDFQMSQTGNYGGIGASVQTHKGRIIVAQPYPNYPAAKAGLQAGDELIRINGEELTGRSSETISEMLKGTPGTEVELTFLRGDKQQKLRLKREKIHISSVPYAGRLRNNVGYIALRSFTQNAAGEILAAWEKMEAEGPLDGLVLDLRNNPGGLLAEAIRVTNLFIPRGKAVVQTRGKIEEWQRTYKTQEKPHDLKIPLTVLINGSSASASEIVAGTLQDYDRAVIIGQRSFGKGLVQESRQLPYGGQIKMTIAKYYTPSGRLIQAIDYAERAEDGRVSKIPDSLRSRFETIGGRPVYDGGGIDPDLPTEQPEVGQVVLALLRDLHLFDYATEYRRKHSELRVEPREFAFSDSEWEDFRQWLAQRDFTYQTQTERRLEKLRQAAQEEGYHQVLEDRLEALADAYTQGEAGDLERYGDFIRQLLAEEIVSRYAFDGGRIANSLRHDAEVDTALAVLLDPSRYRTILSADQG